MKDISNIKSPDTDYFTVINHSFSDCFMNAIKLALSLENTTDAELAAKRSFAYNPQNPEILSLFPQYRDTLTFLSSLIEKNKSKIQKNQSNNKTWLINGYCYLQLGDFPKAFAIFKHIQDQKIDENELLYPEYFYYALAIINHHFNNNSQSYKWYTELMNCSHFSSFLYKEDLYYRFAILCRTLSKFSESITYFTKITNSPPNGLEEADILFQIAYTYQLSGKYEDTENIYKQLLENYPNNIIFKQQYIWFLFISQSNFNIDYIKILFPSTGMNNQNPNLLFVHGCILLKIGHLSSAYDSFKRCLNYYSDSPEFWCLFGILYAKNEQWTDAIIAFQRSLYLNCESEESWMNLGYSYECLQDNESAKRVYQTALMICPSSKLIHERLDNLNNKKINVLLFNLWKDNDFSYFPQLPQSAAKDYIQAIPSLPAFLFGEEDNSKFSKMSTFPVSLLKNLI